MSRCELLVLLLLALPASAQQAPTNGLTREAAVTQALEHSPRLIPAQADEAAAQARLKGARLLLPSNPQLSGTVGPRLTHGHPVDLTIAVSQPLDLFTRGSRVGAAEAELAAARARLESQRVEVAATVKESFGRALAAEQRLQFAEQALSLAQSAVRIAQERFEAGAAGRLEVNTARVEVGRAGRERAVATQALAAALAEVRVLLGMSPETPLTLSGQLALPAGLEPVPEDLEARALARRADLRAVRQTVEAARASQQLASRQVLPTPTIGASYTRDDRTPVVQGSIGLTLPLFNQNQAARGEAAAEVQRAQGSLTALERAVRTEVALAAARYRTARVAAELYADDVVQALEENLELSMEAYSAGKLSFTELLILRRESLEARRGHIEALEELNAAAAGLDRALGTTAP
ncbi:TolC family protein [Corallococcus sp. AB011P]|uniref:TolC family protein n=1 Tax=Corallococcus sp. AB011P TaxID=2316735 RepID=UPI000EA149B5|nr:TolC family protein [Corallococcus sp. AB011P]RKG60906.1 TolC family protein [Corallococcus sp. AB011P]